MVESNDSKKIEDAFKQADDFIKSNGESTGTKLTNNQKLRFYALYKVATEGEAKGKS
jgi:hypothetical protein